MYQKQSGEISGVNEPFPEWKHLMKSSQKIILRDLQIINIYAKWLYKLIY